MGILRAYLRNDYNEKYLWSRIILPVNAIQITHYVYPSGECVETLYIHHDDVYRVRKWKHESIALIMLT